MRTLVGAIPRAGTRRFAAVGPDGAMSRGSYAQAAPVTFIDNAGTFSELGANTPRIYTDGTGSNVIPTPNGEDALPGVVGGSGPPLPTGWSVNGIPGTTLEIVSVSPAGVVFRHYGTPSLTTGYTMSADGGPIAAPEGPPYDYSFELTKLSGTFPTDDLRIRPGSSNVLIDDVQISIAAVNTGKPYTAFINGKQLTPGGPAGQAGKVSVRYAVTVGQYFDVTYRLAKLSVRKSALFTRRGLLIEPPQSNYVPNPRAEGGGAGVIPTGWTIQGLDAGVTLTWLAQKTVNGMTVQPVQLTGTPVASLMARVLFVTGITGTAALGLTGSIVASMSAGSLSNISSVVLRVPNGTPATYPIALTTTPQRFGGFYSFGVDTVSQALQIQVNGTAGQPSDITIDLAIPNLGEGNALTSPILPTPGVQAISTRTAPRLTYPVTGIFGDHGGTVVVECNIFAQSNQIQGIVALDDNTFNNRLYVYLDVNSNTVIAAAFSGGVSSFFTSVGTITPGTPFKLAMSFSTSITQVSISGGGVGTLNGAIAMNAFTLMHVGTVGVNNVGPMNGTIINASVTQDAQRDGTLRTMST